MADIRSPDGKYRYVVPQDDDNEVVYIAATMAPVWSRKGYEAEHVHPPPNPPGLPPALPPMVAPGATAVLPYGRPLRVTDEQDGIILNRGYSYWAQSVVFGDALYAFVGTADEHPKFFRIHPHHGGVDRLGSPIEYRGTGEGWHWSADGHVYLCDGPRLRRVSPFTWSDEIVCDISETHPGCRLWQSHSSDDGQTHCATVQRIVSDGPYPKLGTVVVRHGEQRFIASPGALDESHLTADGHFLIIEENHGNQIIDLATGELRTLTNAEGALAHLDGGRGFMVGEDDQLGACVRIELPSLERRMLFNTWNMGHVSVRGETILVSDHTTLSLFQSFIQGDARLSTLTHVTNHGMVGSGYEFQCHANLSPCGRVAAYVANPTGRFDLYLVGVAP